MTVSSAHASWEAFLLHPSKQIFKQIFHVSRWEISPKSQLKPYQSFGSCLSPVQHFQYSKFFVDQNMLILLVESLNIKTQCCSDVRFFFLGGGCLECSWMTWKYDSWRPPSSPEGLAAKRVQHGSGALTLKLHCDMRLRWIAVVCPQGFGWINAAEVVYSAAQVSMKAGAEEESLQSAIKGGNSDRIMKAIEALPDPPKKAMSMIEGDWQAGQFVVKYGF